jgi:ubiquinone/menaquinone biosynthesis C-methylase UbiE
VCVARLAARDRATTRILHNGCGSSELGVALAEESAPDCFQQVVNGDFAAAVVQQMSKRFPRQTFLIVDAKSMPFRDASLDVIICKGMFDSITADAITRPVAAAAVILEAARCLSADGEYLIFSTFGPGDRDKDMFALLQHPDFDLAVEILPWPPLEIPDQPSSFLWSLKRKPRLPVSFTTEGVAVL